MSDRTIIGGITRLARMQMAAEKQLAQMDAAHKRFMAVQEDTLAQMRVALDDAAVMLGVIPQPGSTPDGETGRELPEGPPRIGTGPQATFTATKDLGDHPSNFRGADL